MLTPDQTSQLRAKLEAERERIAEKFKSALGFAMARDPDAVGRDSIDVSVDEEMYSTEMRLHDREKRLLFKVQAALVRLEAGEIDECEDCGDEISFKRLLARPVTALCVDCKEDREAGEARAGDGDRAPGSFPPAREE